MKMMFASCCSTLVVPHHERKVARFCACDASACWWDDDATGRFMTFSDLGPQAVSVIGVHNRLLDEPIGACGFVRRDQLRQILADTKVPLFEVMQSLVFKLAPGANSSCAHVTLRADLPPRSEVAWIEPTCPRAPAPPRATALSARAGTPTDPRPRR